MISDDLGNPTLPQTIIMTPTKTTPLVYMPLATDEVYGAVKLGDTIKLNENGAIDVRLSEDGKPGLVKPGDSMKVSEDGTIDVKVENYVVERVSESGIDVFKHDGITLTFEDLFEAIKTKNVYIQYNGPVGIVKYRFAYCDIEYTPKIYFNTSITKVDLYTEVSYYVITFDANRPNHYRTDYKSHMLETTSRKVNSINEQTLRGGDKYPTVNAVDEYVTNKIADLNVPTKTSDLVNDGDGESPFATEDYVEANGGKIDKILVNGVEQPIVNKTVNITISDDYVTEEELQEVKDDIDNIEALIPAQANPNNKLADKDFVNSTVQTNTAVFRGNWESWDAVPTDGESYPHPEGYRPEPTLNDYLVVRDASDYTLQTLEGTWRFKYNGVWETDGKAGWRPEYQINETPLTAAQLAALNSGITAGAVSQIDVNTNNIETLSDGQVELNNRVTDVENDLDNKVEIITLTTYNNKLYDSDGEITTFAKIYSYCSGNNIVRVINTEETFTLIGYRENYITFIYKLANYTRVLTIVQLLDDDNYDISFESYNISSIIDDDVSANDLTTVGAVRNYVDSKNINVIDDLESTSSTDALSANQGKILNDKIKDIELFKFPNAVIMGEPTINNGQVSNFSTENYMIFPFILDIGDRNFQIDFSFTTNTDVTTQQNILDSKFGIALAIANGKGLMAVSGNGTSWSGTSVGTINIAPNTTYYARLTWNKLIYKTALSTNGTDYVDDMQIVMAQRPYPRTIYIGGGNAEELGRTPNVFKGIINMNKAYLTVGTSIVWEGMDDVGLATRADISLSNLDEAGIKRIQDMIDASVITAINSNY